MRNPSTKPFEKICSRAQLYAAPRSTAQSVSGARAILPKTTATVSVTGMKTSQQLSERKMASSDETWRSLTCPDKTPRPGREFPAGAMPYFRPCASVTQDRVPRSTIEHPAARPQSLSAAHNSQFRCVLVRFCAFLCALLPLSAVLRTMLTTAAA